MANLKDTLVFGKLTATGTITANKFKGPLEGNADTATKFSSSKTISLSGDVSGTGSSDGGSQWEITTSVADNSHAHTSENISDLSTTLTTWLNSAKSYTDTAVAGVVDSAPDVLNTLKELSAALNNDKDYYVTINNALAGKISKAGDEMSGALTFSTNDAIKYKNGSTRTGVPIRFYGGDANGSAVVIGDGGLTLIGGGESAFELRKALVDTNKTKTNATEELYLTSDSAIYLYTNYQTAASAKITTYDSSGNWTMPGTITATQFTGPSKALYSSGFGNGNFTWFQTSDTFAGRTGWASYLISNHGDGATYYHQILAMPFWGAPCYRRMEDGRNGDTAIKGWYDFITDENMASKLTKYVSGTENYIPKFTEDNVIGNGWQIQNFTGKQGLGYVSDSQSAGLIPSLCTLAYWNGAYGSGTGATTSNLSYCDQGKFGSIVTKSSGDYLPIGGGTLTGSLTFANGTWNIVGDDAMIGDQNVAGAFCIKGNNGTTTLRMYSYDTSVTTTANFQYNTSDKCIDVIFN